MTTDDIAKQLSDLDLKGQAWDDKARELGLKPGQVIPGTQQWVPWRVQDLDPDDIVDFVPQDVPTISLPMPSVNGKKMLGLSVNGLEVVYEVGTHTKTNKMFYNVYKNVLDQNIALENLKKYGPEWGPHSQGGYDNQSTWMYIPYALSFAISLEGHSLRGSEWYEYKDGIPIAINNIKKLAALYFSGDISLNISRKDIAELLFMIVRMRIKKFVNKLRRR